MQLYRFSFWIFFSVVFFFYRWSFYLPWLLTWCGIRCYSYRLSEVKGIFCYFWKLWSFAFWIFAYFSLKHLPITIASPIKATQPILTLLGALLVFGERLNIWQWAGVLTAVISLFLLSRSGKKEGIRFAHNKWIYFMILAVVTGSVSGLYDKYLMTCLDRMNVQVWYNFYQLAIMGVILFTLWYPGRKKSTPFQWRNTIPFISILLVLADFVYFYALSYEDSMISIISLVRGVGWWFLNCRSDLV